MTQLPPHIQQEIEKNFPFGSDATTRLFVNIIAEHAYLAGQDSERERCLKEEIKLEYIFHHGNSELPERVLIVTCSWIEDNNFKSKHIFIDEKAWEMNFKDKELCGAILSVEKVGEPGDSGEYGFKMHQCSNSIPCEEHPNRFSKIEVKEK